MLLGDAVPLMPEQNDGALSRWLEAWQRDGSVSELDGKDLPAALSLLFDPAVLAGSDPMDARPAVRAERVAVRERGPVVVRVWDRDARADGIAGA